MENNSKQKLYYLIGGGLAVVIVVIIAVVALVRGRQGSDGETPADGQPVAEVKKKRISAPQNVIALADRPVVQLRPFGQDGGRFVSIEILSLPKAAQTAEYEIVYNVIGTKAVSAAGAAIPTPAGEEEGGLQAFIGELDLARLPTSTENRFGTCSAGGACINNSVDYGNLTLNFEGSEKYGVNTTWTYFETGTASSQTHDGHFTIAASELANLQDYLILQQIGLPAGLTGEVVTLSDGGKDNGTWPMAYQVSFTKAPEVAEASISFSGASGSQVAVYDGTTWTSYDLTAEVPMGNNYIYALLN